MKIQNDMIIFLLMMITVTLLSCGRFLYYENQTHSKISSRRTLSDKKDGYIENSYYDKSKPSLRKNEETYHTPQDKKKAQKEVIDHLHIARAIQFNL